MILIGGTSLTREELPLSSMLDYQLEEGPGVKVALKAGARTSRCTAVYLQQRYRDVELPDEVAAKTHYFETEAELLALLDNGQAVGAPSVPSAAELVDSVPSLQKPAAARPLTGVDEAEAALRPEGDESKLRGSTLPPPEETEETAAGAAGGRVSEVSRSQIRLPGKLREASSASIEMDIWRKRVEMKDELLAQRDSQLEEKDIEIRELYARHESYMSEIAVKYEETIAEANSVIKEQHEKMRELIPTEEEQRFLQLRNYSDRHLTVSQAGFTKPQIDRLAAANTHNSKIYSFVAGPGDSLYSMNREVLDLLGKGESLLIVDMTGDPYYFNEMMDDKKPTSIDVARGTRSFEDAVLRPKINGQTHMWLQSDFMNDLALLTLPWLDFLIALVQNAEGRKIVFLFNTVTSFAVRHTVSYLSAASRTFVFARANGHALYSLYSVIHFIPSNRFAVIVVDLFADEDMKAIIEDMFQGKYAYAGYAEGEINWKSLWAASE